MVVVLVAPPPPPILFYLKFVTVSLFLLVTLSTPHFGTVSSVYFFSVTIHKPFKISVYKLKKKICSRSFCKQLASYTLLHLTSSEVYQVCFSYVSEL